MSTTEFLLDVAHVQTDKVARTDNFCRLLVHVRYLFLVYNFTKCVSFFLSLLHFMQSASKPSCYCIQT